ncbi:hypothetical protein BFO_1770 [Tannerella forsythia 92A2]|uniref:Uncharacterized protein n=1 Tax=Tannerella forsythia (strain ATCC 43037 / JCM 10827 / CCUG 21028 A / KCTC 5666 / FDC 338) TaxID=203275 RepID=G8UNJ8_TANFA|nr:hypothetical protein BFO_1770 [Tannerella forsythia 92A2]
MQQFNNKHPQGNKPPTGTCSSFFPSSSFLYDKKMFPLQSRTTTNENMKHRHSLVGQGYMLPFVLITFFFFSIVILS